MDENDIIVEEDEGLKQFLPRGFGKQTKEANVAAQIEKTKRAAPEPATISPGSPSSGEDNSQGSEDDFDEDDEFPVSHELVLKTHERAITTLTLDPSGSRLITGSTDCTIKFHDFASMTPTTLRAFKSVDPTATKASANAETHPVHHVEFNPISPAQILVISATPQAKIFSRDGDVLAEFVKGDMYLRDMHNTKGHVSEITTGTWHPTNKNLCVTAGTDSTLRIWDVNLKREQRDVIVHKSRAAGSAGRTRMTAVVWGSPTQGGANLLVAAALDGSLVMWSGDGPCTRPAAEIRDAHKKNTWTGGIDISADGRTVVTRGGDDTIKLWDTRKFKQPISVVEHPSTSGQYTTSNICYSPNASSILAGSQSGHLHILNPATLKAELVTPVTPGSPLITVLWHEKLNQILTGSANAETHVLYNPNTSSRGAAMIMSKAPKRRHIDDDPTLTTDLSQGLSGDSIVNPNGLLTGTNQGSASYAARHPNVGLTASGRSRDPRRPYIPMTTPFAKSQPDGKYIKDHIPLSSMRDEDPREALLKYADKAKNDPLFTNAWKHTQPKTIYAELSDGEEEEEGPDKKRVKQK
ncbi:WD40/YVTN repeat-like-containing domain [Lasallia pustulata]|uniref:WD40/YVTN repeat-like-containing domain n=1 Tax=Lasallia pustulata TaxID=136370 RepID=A0A1W5D9S2_9LECA|nr:WD40/YVTN repeat-like-containing domain [Lasallia pustulata]